MTFTRRSAVIGIAAACVAILTPGRPAGACEPADHFGYADAVVVGRVTAVRQTSHRVLFWGTSEWTAQVVAERRLRGESPEQFVYRGSDHRYDGCVPPDPRPRVGDVLVFPVEKVRREQGGGAGRWEAYDAMTTSEWRTYSQLY